MLHIERLTADITTMGQRTAERQQQREADVITALRWLAEAPAPAELRARLERVTAGEAGWSGALPPTDAPLNAALTAPDAPPPDTTLIAADGSQVYPDRHAAALYYLIQTGGIVFRYDGSTPGPHSRASLHYEDDELYDAEGYLIGAEKVGMQRLVQEMGYLAELTAAERRRQAPTPIYALTDGPLLWPYIERTKEDYLAFEEYLDVLTQIRRAGGLPVGYVERPGGHALVALLWASRLSPEDIPGKLQENPLRLLTDHELMGHFLRPGERSPWLMRPTPTQRAHANKGHAIWFCYLNAGRPGHPIVARVEVPAWAAGDKAAITTLHAALRHQSAVLNGYPYVLARAHEEALVTTQDKAALDSVIQRRLIEQGVLAQPSEKARQKSYFGRKS